MNTTQNPKQPLYKELAELLRTSYISTAAEHAPLPTERSLQEKFGVSRDTVRRALNYLTLRGDIYTRAGSGSYVAARLNIHKTPRLTSFTEDMCERGHEPASATLECGLVEAPDAVARHLRLPPGAQVYKVVRLRTADGLPMAYETAYLLRAPFAQQAPHTTGSLDEQLTRAGYRIVSATQRISAHSLSATEAMVLEQPLSAPALAVHRVGFTGEGTPVEATTTLYRADRYDFEVKVEREGI
ncbi:GntR family transcriptional regulator [Rothia sp. ZJ932]|uniref:GntR family transcriptional regulator n=1 Tax=Rothia sp. ZJ932 TaxID=2810516 RepID=UPI001967221F|nr:GntR family transcriptional regulator [Rothia sp. ZJ932]QRZ61877.1 GntR family transcriptional regulator [Rothia sp. ZJ932]